MLQGAGLGLIFVPLTTVTNDPVPKERMGNATSIFNLMRNVGASIGISMVETMQVRKQQMHINVLGQHVTSTSPQAQQMIQKMTAFFLSRGASPGTGPGSASSQAYEAIWGMVLRQATMLSYNDVFRFLAGMFVVMCPLIFLMKKAKKGGPVMAH